MSQNPEHFPYIDDYSLGEMRAGVVAGRPLHRSDVVYLIDEVRQLRKALLDQMEACEENTCQKTAADHCGWCAPGWAALRPNS